MEYQLGLAALVLAFLLLAVGIWALCPMRSVAKFGDFSGGFRPPSAILKVNGHLSQEAVRRLKEDWARNFGTEANPILVLDDGCDLLLPDGKGGYRVAGDPRVAPLFQADDWKPVPRREAPSAD